MARYTFFPTDNPHAYDRQDADVWLERTREFWKNILIEKIAHIEVPCRKAGESLLAAHVCQIIANDHGDLRGGEGFYDTFYIRDGAYQVMELEEAGLHNTARKAVKLYLDRQRPDGRFESQVGQLDAHGQAVVVLWQFCLSRRGYGKAKIPAHIYQPGSPNCNNYWLCGQHAIFPELFAM